MEMEMEMEMNTEIYNIKCATKGCEHVATNNSRFCVMCRKKRLEEGKEVGVYGY